MATIEQAARAFAEGRKATTHNSRTDGKQYVLHRSVIAEWLTHGNQTVIRFDWHGYHTPTTASHMNDILHAIGSSKRVSYAATRDGKDDEVFDIPVRA